MSKPVNTNRKAYRDYEILERFECGLELKGSEVKSIRAGQINLEDSFARIDENQEVILYNAHISPYEQASYLNVVATRPRKLLLHKAEIERLATKINQKGFTLVPLSIYFNSRGFAKAELALCKGKKVYDKRQTVKRREVDLEVRRALKNRR
jgi:SsrA-binding protein